MRTDLDPVYVVDQCLDFLCGRLAIRRRGQATGEQLGQSGAIVGALHEGVDQLGAVMALEADYSWLESPGLLVGSELV